MLKRIFLITVCLLVVSGCAKKPSPTGGTVMNSGEIAFFYGPGWVVEKEEGYWRFEHPDAEAWAVVMVSDEQLTTDAIIGVIEDKLVQEWGRCSVSSQEHVDVQGRSVRSRRYRLGYYMKGFDAHGIYYGGPEGSFVAVAYVYDEQSWAMQETMDSFLKGLAFKSPKS